MAKIAEKVCSNNGEHERRIYHLKHENEKKAR